MPKFDRKKHDQAFKRTMKFTRYIYIRYYSMLVFFSNVFWLATLMSVTHNYILSGLVILVQLFLLRVFLELFAIQENPDLEPRILPLFFKTNIIWSLFLIGLVFVDLSQYYPFVKDGVNNQVILTVIFVTNSLISLFFLNRMNQISLEIDPISKKIKQLEGNYYE